MDKDKLISHMEGIIAALNSTMVSYPHKEDSVYNQWIGAKTYFELLENDIEKGMFD